MQKHIKTWIGTALTLLSAEAAYAASFSLYTESTVSAIGNYAAGIAAEAADASTGWYNPAGLALIRNQQLVFGGVGVFVSTKLTGSSTFNTMDIPFSYVENFSNLQGGKDGLIPSLHYALPLGERASFGLSLLAPFGLKTNWSERGPLRYAATHTKLETFNLAPELGGQLTEHLALGAGLDLEYSRVKFNRMLGAPALMQFFNFFGAPVTPNFVDSESLNKGDSFGVGFHAGFLTMFCDNHTRIGLNYQSRIRHKFQGSSRLIGPLASPGLDITDPFSLLSSDPRAIFKTNNLYSNTIYFPDIVTLSAYQDVNVNLALLASVVYTGWDSIKTLVLNNAAAFAPPTPTFAGGQVLVNSSSTLDYRNTWRFALGANYYLNEQWMLRVGGGYDQTPVETAHRDIRIPDASRWALAIGGHYQMRPNLGFDAGYTHLFGAEDPRINKTDILGTSDVTVNAKGRVHADLVGLQVVWLMDQPCPVSGPMK